MSRNKKVYLVADAHLDTQWNWTVRESIRSGILKTIVENLDLIDKFPHYRMNFEGAFRYKLAKEYYPELYSKVKDRIAEGRWNVSGAFWDACDVNIPSSEAIMRQILLGNGYFESEFGKRSYDVFLVDCFGFRHALPSIAAHMGLKGFSTQKLTWGVGTPILCENGTAIRPMPDDPRPRMDLGKWIGPDGNYLIACFNENFYSYRFENYGDIPINQREQHLREIEHNEKYAGVAVRNLYYGIGDEGGSCGPVSAKMAEEAFCDPNGGLFETISASSDQIFLELTQEQVNKLPVYRDGLPIPHGYGAMTSHTINKRWNRKCEQLADAAERANVLAGLLRERSYPSERFDFAWKQFLWHQFHDDITGTSCGEAYRVSNNDLVISQNIFASEIRGAISDISSCLDTNTAGIPVAVYNPVAAKRKDVVSVECGNEIGSVRVFGPNGTEVPSQISFIDGNRTIRFVVEAEPVSVGIYSIVENMGECTMQTSLKIDGNGLENGRYRVSLNDAGEIVSVFDKTASRDMLSGVSRLEILPDSSTEWPSWELNWADYSQMPVPISSGETTIFVEEDGPAVATLLTETKFRNSFFRQRVSLFEGGERVDIDSDITWREPASLLTAVFPLSVENPVAEFDGGLGCIKGENNNYPYFQHNVHQFADLTDVYGSYGITICNDCKYGMDKPDDRTLRLTLIHTPPRSYLPESGQDTQDWGRNIFRYSLFGHSGSRKRSAEIGAEVNQPIYAFSASRHAGRDKEVSLLSVNDERVQVRAVKKEEKGNRLIVRFQETGGQNLSNVRVTIAFPVMLAEETNGYEETVAKANTDNGGLLFDMGAYSVKTFALSLGCTGINPERSFKCLSLPLDLKTVTAQGESDSSDKITLPKELFSESVLSGGVPFRLGSADGYQAMACCGQTISLPHGVRTAYILAASQSGDRNEVFKLDGRTVDLKIQDQFEDIGAWDLEICDLKAKIKRDDIAVCYSHTHKNGEDMVYRFAYLFKYRIDVGEARSLVLPYDDNIHIYAITVSDEEDITAETFPTYDSAENI